ncbi:MAG: winged helix-turn-helix domain-containing protein [Acidobacteriota bacterium]
MLDPRLLDVLVALAVQPGEVRTRDELLNEVWDGAFVHENSLSQAISRLRKALGDDRHRPLYIETISRTGYRLVAPVEAVPVSSAELSDEVAEVASPSPEPQAPVADGAPARRRRWLLAAGAVTLAVAALVIWELWCDLVASSPAPMASVAQIRPEVTLPGKQFGPRLSPDGRYVAFAWQEPDGESFDIWLQAVGDGSPVRVTESADPERQPIWSSDGLRLAFVRSAQASACGIYSLPIVGGVEERLGDCWPGMRSLDWSPDGAQLAFSAFAAPDPDPAAPGPRALFLLELATGEVRQLTHPAAEMRGDIEMRFSPDGRHLAFEREFGPNRQDVAVVSLVDGGTRLLTSHRWGHIRGLDWSSAGDAVLFASNRSGRYRLWKVPLAGGEPEPLPIHDSWVTQPSVARTGGRLVYRTFRDSVDLWELPLDDSGLAAGEAVQRVPSTRSEEQPAWSPEGDLVAFISDRTGSRELWSGRRDGSELIRHTDFAGPGPGSPAWSPNGRDLVFDAAAEGHGDLWTVDRSSRHPRRLTDEVSEERNGTYSRDGRRLYFASDRSGQWDLWSMPSAGGEAAQVTFEGGFLGQESPDGRHLFYVRPTEPGIWRIPRDGGRDVGEPVVNNLALWDWGSWVVGERGLYYVQRGPAAIVLIPFTSSSGEVGEPRIVLQPEKQIPFHNALALSADGRSLLFAMIDHSDDELMTVDLEGL